MFYGERLIREMNWQRARSEGEYDVAILGGGINGACLYDALCRRGHRTLLLDKGDFASGTSQASGMMVWGGLLYLKDLDLSTVAKLSLDRDRMIERLPDRISSQYFRYLPDAGRGRSRAKVWIALWIYWLMGLGSRRRPRAEREFSELELIRPGLVEGSLLYEEGFLKGSDARFVLSWIAPHHAPGQVALNHCDVAGELGPSDRAWRLDLKDNLYGKSCSVNARVIVNCAGVWTDAVNAQFGVSTPFTHALSKGVYLSVERPPQHQSLLVFELGAHGDVITCVPWGPVSMWGPSESAVAQIAEGLTPEPADLDFLLDQYNRRFKRPIDRRSVISIRCGIRPLVVDRQAKPAAYPLSLSRRQEVLVDRFRPWVSCYGGKLTGCTRMAGRALREVERLLGGPARPGAIRTAETALPAEPVEWASFPGLNIEVPSARWAACHEYCCTLEDYMRRRTPIAQWVPRMGLGREDVNALAIRELASQLAEGDAARTEMLLVPYREKVEALDRLLEEPVPTATRRNDAAI